MLDENETAPEAERDLTPAITKPEGSTQEPQDGGERPEGDDAPSSEAEAAPEPAPDGEAKPERARTPEWLQKRFDEMTRQRHEEARRAEAAERRAAELEARWERAQRGEPEPEPQAGRQDRQPQSPADIDAETEKRAAAIVARRTFDQNCNAVVDQGSKEYGADFNEALSTFRMFGGLDPSLAQAAIDAGNAHKTLFHLGTNPEEYERIVALPERQQAIALARLSDKLSAPPPPKPISRTPAPIDPVGTNGGRQEITDPDKLSTAEWMRRRNAGEIR